MFITPNDIMEKLEELVSGEFPDEPIYRELVEHSHQRPSTLIEYEKCEGDVEMGSNMVEPRPTFRLTTFVKVDEYIGKYANTYDNKMLLVAAIRG